ncbi:MAG: glycerol-3-phosphate acyltransferase [Lachnospiraceae bacterium]|nr:glycerol-3-phosphate acyltransferase [Lachnospiraceae bacterium]
MEIFIRILFIAVGFLSGSIMFCRIIPKRVKHEDICEISDDCNPGAFNVFKHFGKGLGILCLILDLLKGFIPVFLASMLTNTNNFCFCIIMIAPVLGHAIGLFDRFHGGKCISVSFGVTAGVLPVTWIAFAVLALLYILFSALIKIKPNRVRSIVVFVLFAIIAGVACGVLNHKNVAIACALIAVIAVIKHLKVNTKFKRDEILKHEEEERTLND